LLCVVYVSVQRIDCFQKESAEDEKIDSSEEESAEEKKSAPVEDMQAPEEKESGVPVVLRRTPRRLTKPRTTVVIKKEKETAERQRLETKSTRQPDEEDDEEMDCDKGQAQPEEEETEPREEEMTTGAKSRRTKGPRVLCRLLHSLLWSVAKRPAANASIIKRNAKSEPGLRECLEPTEICFFFLQIHLRNFVHLQPGHMCLFAKCTKRAKDCTGKRRLTTLSVFRFNGLNEHRSSTNCTAPMAPVFEAVCGHRCYVLYKP
jgi:hypothetical protein